MDIAPLAELFRARFSEQLGRPVRGFTPAALSMLESLNGRATSGSSRTLSSEP